MENLRISIVTPSFNQGKFIHKAIESVVNQGYENFEHIIFDNNSTDETLEVISRYPHVKLTSEPDKGQSDALNKGFKAASGDIIGWLNADDYYLPETFSKVNNAFESPVIDAIYSNAKFVDQDDNFLRNLKTHRPVKWMSLFYTYIQSTTFFFKKQIVDDSHLLDNSLHLSMDMEFYARLLYSGYKFQHIDDYFACFRWHESNKSSPTKETVKKNMKEVFYIINKVGNKSIDHNDRNEALYKFAVNALAKPIRQVLVKTKI